MYTIIMIEICPFVRSLKAWVNVIVSILATLEI